MSIFNKRRTQFTDAMKRGIAILVGAHKAIRASDTTYPFRQESSFAYLTNCVVPDAVAALSLREDKAHLTLFVPPRRRLLGKWEDAPTLEEIRESTGADEVLSIEEIDETLPRLVAGQSKLFYRHGIDENFDRKLDKVLRALSKPAVAKKGVVAPSTFQDPHPIIHEMRLIKDGHGLESMRRACQISIDAHIHGMAATKVGMPERELQVEMEFRCLKAGAESMAYGSIVASGDNANVFHYQSNASIMQSDQLVVVDLGCEYQLHASDITRTWPVSGTFTEAQRRIYDLVLAAQSAGIEACRPGNSYDDVQRIVAKVLTEGLLSLGVLKGSVEEHVEAWVQNKPGDLSPCLRDFYGHGMGHWIGLDVHDCGRYRIGDEWRQLEPGMCLTVEPGLYFNSDHPAPYRSFGVRIEDVVHVTKDGPEVLSAGLPRSADEVEAACRGEF